MGSLEDLFERKEVAWNSYDNILSYLSNNGKRNKNSYKNTAVILSEPSGLKDMIDRTEDYDELRKIKMEIKGLEIDSAKKELNAIAETKMKKISEELSRISEERKQKRLEEERIERDKIKREKDLRRIESEIKDLSRKKPILSRGELNKLEDKLSTIENSGVDVSDVRGNLNDIISRSEESREKSRLGLLR